MFVVQPGVGWHIHFHNGHNCHIQRLAQSLRQNVRQVTRFYFYRNMFAIASVLTYFVLICLGRTLIKPPEFQKMEHVKSKINTDLEGKYIREWTCQINNRNENPILRTYAKFKMIYWQYHGVRLLGHPGKQGSNSHRVKCSVSISPLHYKSVPIILLNDLRWRLVTCNLERTFTPP